MRYVGTAIHLATVVDLSWTINAILREAYIGGGGVPQLWLATHCFGDAPQKPRDKRNVNLGTEGPVSETFRSPLIGKKVEDVANWLKKKPDTVDLDPRHFVILDKGAAENTIIVCRLGNAEHKGDALYYMRLNARNGTSFLVGHDAYDWEQWSGKVQKATKIDYGDES